jgi:hypothetical protein
MYSHHGETYWNYKRGRKRKLHKHVIDVSMYFLLLQEYRLSNRRIAVYGNELVGN